MTVALTEARTTEATPVGNGRYLLRIIDAGKGSSGIYPASTLQQAATERVFPRGTHCYLDHPSESEEYDRPERTVKDLAAVLAEDARYDPDTQSLVAEARVFSTYRPMLDDLTEDIGMSIRALAERADDGTITRITQGMSVDFVTHAGRGGKILAVLESAAEAATNDRRDQLEIAVQQAYSSPERHAYVRDFDEARRLVWFFADRTLWEQSWEPSEDDTSTTLVGDRTEVRAVSTYIPVNSPTQVGETTEETSMPNIDEAELNRLRAAESRSATLEDERATAIARAEEAEAEAAALAGSLKAAKLAAIEAADLPDPAKARARAAVEADPAMDAQEAIKAERDYIAAVTDGVSAATGGFGVTTPTESRPRTNPWGRTRKED